MESIRLNEKVSLLYNTCPTLFLSDVMVSSTLKE